MKKNPFDYKIFADCGAPSLYNKLSRKTAHKGIMGTKFSERKYDDFSYTETPEYLQYRKDFIKFIKANEGTIDFYSNLDVINNPELTWKNQLILEKAGLTPIPVFHLGSDTKWLDAMIDSYDYIALGGLVPNPTSVLIPWLDKIWKEHILDKDGFPKVRVHGFACTAIPLMTRYPWYSVDSATCRKLAMYGWITLPEYSSEKLKTIQVSSRDIALKDRLTSGVIKELERRANRLGLTIDILSDSIIQRVIWNYITFSEQIQRNVPAFPWNFKTRKAKKDAEEYLTFYFAGSLSKKEEEVFWKGVTDPEITKLKGRLQSFFYKGNLEHVINLKK
jgi:hypothetical protein